MEAEIGNDANGKAGIRFGINGLDAIIDAIDQRIGKIRIFNGVNTEIRFIISQRKTKVQFVLIELGKVYTAFLSVLCIHSIKDQAQP